jgi:hypothetical protein
MKLEWIAAALNPWDVSPHPNFMSTEVVTPPGLIGLLAQMRWPEFERLTKGEAVSESASTRPVPHAVRQTVEMAVVRAVYDSLIVETTEAGADRLRQLSFESDLDPACRATAAIFASVSLCERDRHRDAIELLERTLDSLLGPDDDDMAFVRAFILQQLAFRQHEYGLDSLEASTTVLELLSDVRPSHLSKFRLSKGVRWRSSHTVRLIIDELIAVADTHIVNLEKSLESDSWIRLVRSPSPELELRVRRWAEDGLSKYVDEVFREQTRSTSRTVFATDPVEPGVYSTLLHYELVGAGPQARTRRAQLGRLRITRSAAHPDPTWSVEEGLRLLRHGSDFQALDLALRSTRAGGPLQALKASALQILANRVEPERLGRPELSVLAAGAHLLMRAEASRALDHILSVSGQRTDSKWESPSVLQEAIWEAAVELAGPAERLDEVAKRLLDEARRTEPSNELLIRAITRVAMKIEWEGTDESTRDEWASWLMSKPSSVTTALVDAVGAQVGVGDVPPDIETPIERAAAYLNRFFRTGEQPSEEDLSGMTEAVESRLASIRIDAGSGRHSFGAISAGDVAAGLALHFDQTSLWGPLVDFLLDFQVLRDEKDPPFSRLANAEEPIPSAVLQRLASEAERLLNSTSLGPFSDDVVPFPAALRFFAANDLLPEEQFLGEVTRLSGSSGPTGRTEAARTVSFGARLGIQRDWVTALAIHLSHDSDPVVRGEAARGFGWLVQRQDQPLGALIESRILELLEEDGLVVPLLTLSGLQESGHAESISPVIKNRIEEIAAEHSARGVRLRADALLRQF